MDEGALALLECEGQLVWVSAPMKAPGGDWIQPFVLRDGEGYQPRLRHADGSTEAFDTARDFGTAYAEACRQAGDWLKAKTPAKPAPCHSSSTDFAGLDGLAWQGDPVTACSQQAIPFVLHDRDQYQARLLHPDGGLAVFASESSLAGASRTAVVAAEQWLLERATTAHWVVNPELFDAKTVHSGPTFSIDTHPVPVEVRPMVSKDLYSRYHAHLYNSEPGLEVGDMYFVAGPFSSLQAAKDVALVGAFGIQLPTEEGQSYGERQLLLRELALGYLSHIGEWGANLGKSEEDDALANAALLDAADINRLLVLDPDIADMLPMSDATVKDRLVAIGIRANEMRLEVSALPDPSPQPFVRFG